MASAKDLKKRIATVKNTQQTTRAMKMVSAAKLRRAQEAILAHRPYARRIESLIKLVAGMPDAQTNSRLLQTGEDLSGQKKRLTLVVVTSDRGLCGGFNSNIIKTTQRWLASNADDYESVELAFVGRRGFDFFKTKKVTLGKNYVEAGGKVTFDKAKGLADQLIASYLNEQVDEVKFIYNEFKNAVSQKTLVEDFLPLRPVAPESGDPAAAMIVKPSPKEIMDSLLSKHFEIQAFRILLESQAGEHGARMSAMENATKNAGEMIKKLTLDYNKQRQGGITRELLEIIAGSESQKASA